MKPLLKFTVINFIIGAAITLILSTLLVLGLKVFIPPPEYPKYSLDYERCATGDQSCYDREQQEYRKKQNAYDEAFKEHSGKIFIAANISGLVILLIGIAIFAFGLGTNIAAGIILAGAFGIVYGYIWGWEGPNDALKFGIGLIVALVVIGGGVLVNRMHAKAKIETPQTK